MTNDDLIVLLEIARVCLRDGLRNTQMRELDLSDEELERLEDVVEIELNIELPVQPCPYNNTVRDGNGKHVPCGVKVDWFDGDSSDYLYCGQCQTDFAAHTNRS